MKDALTQMKVLRESMQRIQEGNGKYLYGYGELNDTKGARIFKVPLEAVIKFKKMLEDAITSKGRYQEIYKLAKEEYGPFMSLLIGTYRFKNLPTGTVATDLSGFPFALSDISAEAAAELPANSTGDDSEYDLTKDDYEAIGPGVYLSADYEVQILGDNDEGYNPKYDPDNNGELGSLLQQHIMELEDRGSSRGMVAHFDTPDHYAEVGELAGEQFDEDTTVGEVMNAIWGLWELQVGASVPEDFWYDE